jgi:hypothetical protein
VVTPGTEDGCTGGAHRACTRVLLALGRGFKVQLVRREVESLEGSAVLVSLSESGADEARLDTLSRQMRAELWQLDVQDVRPAPADAQPPTGSRGFDVGTIGQIVVAMLGTQGLAGLISTMLGWVGRGHEATRTVRLEIDGDVLELSAASSEDQDRLVTIFLNKHAGKV